MATSIVYPGQTGVQTAYPLPFEYLSRSHVKATVDGIEVAFTFSSTFMISISPAPVGDLRIYRETPKDEPVNTYTDGSVLLSVDLNASFIQSVFIAQEVSDQLPVKTLSGNWNMANLRVTQVADPVDLNDAANREFVEATAYAAATAANTPGNADTITVTTRTALKALNTGTKITTDLRDGERLGVFKWTTGDFSAQVAADTQEAIYIKSDAVAASSGAWVRQFHGGVYPEWFGASSLNADNKTALQAAFNLAALIGKPLKIVGKTYYASGPLLIRNKLTVKGSNGGTLAAKVGGYSGSTGAFVTNVSPIQSERAVSDFWFDGLTIDLSLITYGGNTTNSENCFGLARGAARGRITNCTFKGATANFGISSGGYGGKGVGLDGGVRDIFMRGNRFERNYLGIWVRGNEGSFSNGLDGTEQTTRISITDSHFEDCQVAIGLQARDPNEDPDREAADFMVRIQGVTYHNCGFCPSFPSSSSARYKSGVIMLGEAQNVLITDVQGYNDADYIAQKGGWPTTGTGIGQGLSGNIGAVIYGWGSSVTIRNVQHNGDVDHLWIAGRAFALGDDGSPTQRIANSRFFMDNIRHIGSCTSIVRQDAYSPVLSSTALAARLTNIVPDVLTSGIVDASCSALVYLHLEVFNTNNNSVKGSAAFLYSTVGNNFSQASTDTWIESLRVAKISSFKVLTFAANGQQSLQVPDGDGILAISCGASLAQFMVAYRLGVGAANQFAFYGAASVSNVALATGGTPGSTASTLTLTMSDTGLLTLDNQRGAIGDLRITKVV